MIRINLLSEGRKPAVAKQSRFSGFDLGDVDLGSLLLVALIVLSVLVALAQNFLLGRRISAKQDLVAEAQAEVARLEPILKEVEEFKAKKAELQRKVEVIQSLKANQRGPVQVMDKVSLALPELLWLSQMEMSGDTIEIKGEAFNTNAVANFIENLDKVPEFQEPDLKGTSQRGPVYTFTITFNFTQQGSARAEPVATAG